MWEVSLSVTKYQSCSWGLLCILTALFVFVSVPTVQAKPKEGVVFTSQTGDMQVMECDTCTLFELPTADAVAIATSTGDFDGDGQPAAVYLASSDTIQYTDKPGELNSIDISSQPAKTQNTLLAVGYWDDSATYVYYAGSNGDIYRVRPGSAPQFVLNPNNGVQGVAGFGDVDAADTAQELVYVDNGNLPRHIDEMNTEELVTSGDKFQNPSNLQASTDDGIGAGAPADYDRDGKAELPIVTSSQNPYILHGNEAPEPVGSTKCQCAQRSAVAITNFDLNEDTAPEFVYQKAASNDDNASLKYFENYSDSTTKKTATRNGEPVVPSTQRGITATDRRPGDTFAFDNFKEEFVKPQLSKPREGIIYTGSNFIETLEGDSASIETLASTPFESLVTTTLDADSDSDPDVIYLENSTTLVIYDVNDGEQRTVDLTGYPAEIAGNKLIAAGEWGDSLTVVYKSDSNRKIYGIRADTTTIAGNEPQLIADPNSNLQNFAGFGNIDGLGFKELVFTDDGVSLHYMHPTEIGSNQSFPTVSQEGQTLTPQRSDAVGSPRDFTGDKTAEIPIVANDGVALVEAGESARYLGSFDTTTSCGCANAAPVTMTDVDQDTPVEVVYQELGTGGDLSYVDDDGSTIKVLDTAGGTQVTTAHPNALGSVTKTSFEAAFEDDLGLGDDTSGVSALTFGQTVKPKEGIMFTQSDTLAALEYDGGPVVDLSLGGIQVLSATTFDSTVNGSGQTLDLFFALGDTTIGWYDRDNRDFQLLSLPDTLPIDTTKSLLSAGTMSGNFFVPYPQQNNDKIVLFGPDGFETVDPVNGVNAVAGFGDVEGDGQNEVVFVDNSSELLVRYFELSDVGTAGTFPTLNQSLVSPGGPNAVGAPGDFFGNHRAEVPIVGSNNGAAFIRADSPAVYLGSDTQSGCNCAEAAPVAVTDIDFDTPLEFVYQDKTSNKLKYFDNDGITKKTIHDSHGQTIETSNQHGIASITKTYEEAFSEPDTNLEPIFADTIYHQARGARMIVRTSGISLTQSKDLYSFGSNLLASPTFDKGFFTNDLTALGVTAEAVAPGFTDYDGDSVPDVPYLTSTQTIKFIDREDPSSPRTGGYPLPADKEARVNKTLMAVGSFNYVRSGLVRSGLTGDSVIGGDTPRFLSMVLGRDAAVYYAGKQGEAIYRVGSPSDNSYSETPELVAEPHSGVSAISGFGDVDNDFVMELVFADTNYKLHYLEESEIGESKSFPTFQHGTSGGPAVGTGVGLGQPILFPDTEPIPLLNEIPVNIPESRLGHAAVPVVGQNNGIVLLYADQPPVHLVGPDTSTSCQCAAKAPIASLGSGIVFQDSSTQNVKIFDFEDTTVKTVTNTTGNPISADLERGVIPMHFTANRTEENILPCIIERIGTPDSILTKLREFRDHLLDTSVGRYLTNLYYEWFS